MATTDTRIAFIHAARDYMHRKFPRNAIQFLSTTHFQIQIFDDLYDEEMASAHQTERGRPCAPRKVYKKAFEGGPTKTKRKIPPNEFMAHRCHPMMLAHEAFSPDAPILVMSVEDEAALGELHALLGLRPELNDLRVSSVDRRRRANSFRPHDIVDTKAARHGPASSLPRPHPRASRAVLQQKGHGNRGGPAARLLALLRCTHHGPHLACRSPHQLRPLRFLWTLADGSHRLAAAA